MGPALLDAIADLRATPRPPQYYEWAAKRTIAKRAQSYATPPLVHQSAFLAPHQQRAVAALKAKQDEMRASDAPQPVIWRNGHRYVISPDRSQRQSQRVVWEGGVRRVEDPPEDCLRGLSGTYTAFEGG